MWVKDGKLASLEASMAHRIVHPEKKPSWPQDVTSLLVCPRRPSWPFIYSYGFVSCHFNPSLSKSVLTSCQIMSLASPSHLISNISRSGLPTLPYLTSCLNPLPLSLLANSAPIPPPLWTLSEPTAAVSFLPDVSAWLCGASIIVNQSLSCQSCHKCRISYLQLFTI